MFDSLKAWCKIPIRKVNSVGYKPNSEPDVDHAQIIHVYMADENINIIDNTGHEVLSSTQIYLDPHIDIKSTDMIMLANEEIYSIKKIKEFYDGNTGLLDIRVVYL